jgi:murein DD-endopeptidase MepM/ murein hydrolase activator NlpD
MTLARLKAGRLAWIGKERGRKILHTDAQKAVDRARANGVHPRQSLINHRDKRSRQLDEARGKIKWYDAQIAIKSRSGSAKGTYAGSPLPGVRPVATTHQTAGLPGYPAVDYFANAGTPCVSPVTGKVTRLSGHDPSGGPVGSVHGPFGLSVYIEGGGKTYFLTHMGSRTVRVGQKVKQGQKIGTVGNYARWGGTDHIHQGVHG